MIFCTVIEVPPGLLPIGCELVLAPCPHPIGARTILVLFHLCAIFSPKSWAIHQPKYKANHCLPKSQVFNERHAKTGTLRGTEHMSSCQRGQRVLFSVVFTPPHPSHHGSVWVLPVISLLLANTVSPVQACLFLIIWWERFRVFNPLWDRREILATPYQFRTCSAPPAPMWTPPINGSAELTRGAL